MFNYVWKAGVTSKSVTLRIIDALDGTPETGVVFNTAGIDLQYRREGAASVAITEATLAALTTAWASGGFLHIGNGYYRLDVPDAALAAGSDGVLIHGIVTGMVVIGAYVQLVAYDPFDTVRLGLTAVPAAVPGAAGGLFIAGTNAATTVTTAFTTTFTGNVTGAVGSVTGAVGSIAIGGIAAASFAAGAIDAAAIATDAITSAELSATAVTEVRSLASGTADSGTTTTMVDAARTEADTDYWVGQMLVPTSGNIAGQARYITGFNAATDTLTFAPATTQAWTTQTYEIWPGVDYLRPTTSGRTLDVSATGEAGVDWANIGSPTTAQNLSGTNIDVDQVVASVSGAVGSVTGTVGSVSGNVSGNVTGSVGSLAAQAKTDVNAEVLDVLVTDTFAEPGQGAPGVNISLKDKIGYLYKAFRNRITQTSTTLSIYADDAVTVDQKATVSDDSTTYSRGEISTGP